MKTWTYCDSKNQAGTARKSSTGRRQGHKALKARGRSTKSAKKDTDGTTRTEMGSPRKIAMGKTCSLSQSVSKAQVTGTQMSKAEKKHAAATVLRSSEWLRQVLRAYRTKIKLALPA